MTELATITDVETAIGRSLTTTEAERAHSLLIVASAAVEDYTHYRFAPGTYTVGRKPASGKVRLPADVASVTSVTDVDQATGAETAVTDYTLRGSSLYGLEPCWVEVEFTVTSPIPESISALVAGIVSSTMSGPPVGAESAQAGPYQMSFVNSSGKVWLSASDKLVLGKYRQGRKALALI